MKTVLLAGGLGTRLSEETALKPKLPILNRKEVLIANIGCGDGWFFEFFSGNNLTDIFGIESGKLRTRNA